MQSRNNRRLKHENATATDIISILDVVKPWLCNTELRRVLDSQGRSNFSPEGVKELFEVADSLEATVYTSAAEHFAASQFVALFKKYPFTPSEAPMFDPQAKAWRTFKKAEWRCKRYNLAFRLRSRFGLRHAFILDEARRWIRSVIGVKPDLNAVYKECYFGPGSNVGVTGNATSAMRKLIANWTVTPRAVCYLLGSVKSNFHISEFLLRDSDSPFCLDSDVLTERFREKLRVIDHNKITFVPKTAKTERTIAIEPLGNSFLQLGVNSVLVKKLARHGINLRDQSRNQRFAYVGSLGGADPYCTIDLSSASDSLSIEIVRKLLPECWFSFLDDLRSPSYLDPYTGHSVRYEKFCSMGNGFCFPIETLIFAGLTHAVLHSCGFGDDFTVYGDDIACPRSVGLLLAEVLSYCGFKVNPDKSFFFGPFRESCGSDYFGGVAVRPIFLDYRLDDYQSIIKFHNSLQRRDILHFWDEFHLRSLVPKGKRFMRNTYGPIDTAFEVTRDVFMSSNHVRWDRNLQRWRWKEFLTSSVGDPIPAGTPARSALEMWAALRGSPSSQPYTLRRKTRTRTRLQ